VNAHKRALNALFRLNNREKMEKIDQFDLTLRNIFSWGNYFFLIFLKNLAWKILAFLRNLISAPFDEERRICI
jgi:hypothetical protein